MELAPGQRFGAFEIRRLAGRGATGTVYVAEQVHLGRMVALKVLSGDYAADEQLTERFIRESRTAAGLDHLHIVPIYDAGEEQGVPYLAMKLVPGGDLAGALAQHPQGLPPARVQTVVEQIGDALDSAASRGLVHRDVKPANILIEPRGERWHTYLSDFGIAKHSAMSTLTKTNQFVGTLLYIAPEQIEGKATTGATDQYSLGCVLFECLTGIPPFQSAGGAVSLLHAHLQLPPPRVTAHRPELAPAIDTVVARAMAKNPLERYPTCLALAEAARSALAGGPDAAGTEDRQQPGPEAATAVWPGAATIPQPAPRPRRRRTAGIVTGLVVVALLGAGGVMLAVAGREPGTADPATSDPTAAPTSTGGPNPTTRPRPTGNPEQDPGPTGDPTQPPLPPDVPVAFTRGEAEGSTPTAVVVVRPGGDPVVWTDQSTINRQASWLPDYQRLVFSSDRGGSFGLWLLDGAGADPTQLTGEFDVDPAVSPDGTTALFARFGPEGSDLWAVDLASGEQRQVTAGPGNDLRPAWSADGGTVAFMSDRAGDNDIWLLPWDPSTLPAADAQRVGGTAGADDFHPAWTPDGSAIVFASNADGTYDLLRVALDGGAPQVLIGDASETRNPDVSPDGAFLAYQRDRPDGGHDVWIATITGEEPRLLAEDASDPAW